MLPLMRDNPRAAILPTTKLLLIGTASATTGVRVAANYTRHQH